MALPRVCSHHGWTRPDDEAFAQFPLITPVLTPVSLSSRTSCLADYYHGRCIIAAMATLTRDPQFHSSSFALVPKKDKPIHLDGRIIHDLSAPDGQSVNDQTDSTASPDATWNQFVSIARRVLEFRRRYPGYTIYAMIADIADAFHHVPTPARHASIFWGSIAAL
ncbi:hypothetical protein F444_14166 [Phytophthora nicotianae P1976]|uniref:Uncharacterized protein n=1 Tax=Phytophthora nicotianae P1976 TaxID=1317066 RepID=A0A080ZRB5_PHYNI|nr:hypothetical protein F444_14166 [Phytophthora nicotianae P1976]